MFPLWMPFAMVGIPTAYLWWRDRRTPPGHCPKCGYNLTGNVSGICPECGTPIQAEQR
jgi:predicted amidophosphoribosyltransferase